MKRIRNLILLFSLLLFPMNVLAGEDEMPLTCSGPDAEGEYHYEWADYGGFYTNLLMGKEAECGYIEFEEGLTWQFTKDFVPFSYVNGDLLWESGEYKVYIFPSEDTTAGFFTTFTFSLTGFSAEEEQQGMDMDAFLPSFEDNSNMGQQTADRNEMDMEAMMAQYADIAISEQEMHFIYSEELGNLLFQAGDLEILSSNVPNGAVVASAVQVVPASRITQYVYQNGELINAPEDNQYKEPGCYEIISTTFLSEEEGSKKADSSSKTMLQTRFVFRIIEDGTSEISVISAPEGFRFDSITYEGQAQEIPEHGFYFMEKEGNYRFVLISNEDDSLYYTLEFCRDTIAPFLEFSKEINGGNVETPLVYSCKEKNVTYEIYRNNERYMLSEPELNYGGYYRIIVSDTYGNEREYEFNLVTRYHFNKGLAAGIGIGILLLIILFMYNVRHHMRVV